LAIGSSPSSSPPPTSVRALIARTFAPSGSPPVIHWAHALSWAVMTAGGAMGLRLKRISRSEM
jgi:hypothetical protein